jgi:hypothetical protein
MGGGGYVGALTEGGARMAYLSVCGQPARVPERPSFLAALTMGIGCPVNRPSLTHCQSRV